MHTKLLLHTSQQILLTQKHSNCIEFAPLPSPVESSKIMTTYAARLSNIFHLFSYFSLIQPLSRYDNNVTPRVDSTSGQHSEHPHASQAATSPTELSRHLSAFTSRTCVPDRRIEAIVTASVGPVWSSQHLEHNTQRQKPLRALLRTLLPPSKGFCFL